MGNHFSHQMDALKKNQEYIAEMQKIKVIEIKISILL